MRPTTTARIAIVAGFVILTAGCGSSDDSPKGAGHSAAPTSSFASHSSRRTAQPSSAGDAPIGGQSDLDLSTMTSARSFPPDQESSNLATDCYAGSSRIYDRHGITCADAKTAVGKYEKSSGAAKGAEAKVDSLTCSHNPKIMVNQGAAPAKCVDAQGSVVFNWRYPGAPRPE